MAGDGGGVRIGRGLRRGVGGGVLIDLDVAGG